MQDRAGTARNSVIAVSAFCGLTCAAMAHALELVSVSTSGDAGNYSSYTDDFTGGSQPISADGRYVVFQSSADNLVVGDTNGVPDIFLRDRQSGTTELISVDSNEVVAVHAGCGLEIFECGSRQASVSNDGRYVAFLSNATNLVASDTNGETDAFVRDRLSGETIRVSVDPAGQELLVGITQGVMVAGGGGFALVYGNYFDGMNSAQFIRYDLASRTAELLNIPTGLFGFPTSVSDDGNLVAFWDLDGAAAVQPAYRLWVWDIDQQTVERIDVDSNEVPANAVRSDLSFPTAVISGNGQFVAFSSTADNLVANDTNADPDDTCAPGDDVFLRDLVNGTTERVSITTAGEQAELPAFCLDHQTPVSISADGTTILFSSDALNFDPLSPEGGFFDDIRFYLYSTATNELQKLYSSETRQFLGGLFMSADGNHFVFQFADTAQDILQWPLNSEDSELDVYHGSLADLTKPDADGDELADQDEVTTFLTDPAKMDTDDDGLSDSAEVVIGTNPSLADSDSDGVNDISDVSPINGSVSTLATMEIISVGEAGAPGSDFTGFAPGSAVYSSGDGRFVVFNSSAEDLVSIDTNGATDVFLRDRQNETTELISQSTAGVVAEYPNDSIFRLQGSVPRGVSDDGRYVVFTSVAANLVDNDVNEMVDLFIRDRQAGTTSRVHVTQSELDDEFAFSRDGQYLFFSDGGQAYRYEVQSQLASPFAINALPGATVLSASSDGQTLLVQGVSQGLWHYDVQGDVATQVLAPVGGFRAWFTTMISGNGRYVVFGSEVDTLVPGDSNRLFPECGGDGADVFIWDSTDGTFELVSVSSSDEQAQYAPFCGPDFENYPVAVSDDGSLVAFNSKATNLDPATDIFDGDSGLSATYLRNRTDGTTTLLNAEYQDLKQSVFALGMSGDGSSLFLYESEFPFNPVDDNTLADLYAFDLTAFLNTGRPVRGDQNADGKADIFWRNVVNGQNAIWLMDGDQRLANVGLQAADSKWAVVGRGDYDGSGTADILWRKVNPGQPDNGQVAVWLMQGATRTANRGLVTVGSDDWQVAGDGDFNGDGTSDVLWRNTATGQNALWLMQGGAINSNVGIPSAGNLNWSIVGDGDHDGDGKADIVWFNASTGRLAVWFMDGANRLSNEAMPLLENPGWELVGDGDFNADGKADLLWRNGGTGNNALWLMDGSNRVSNRGLPAVTNPSWTVAGDGDHDGDGTADILWRNGTTGRNVIWFMDGGTRTDSKAIPSVPAGNWDIVNVD